MEVLLISEPRETVALSGEFAGVSAPLASVAWDREIALIVSMGEQRTGGYAVRVTEAAQVTPSHIHVRLDLTRPGRSDFVTQAFTHPYTVTRILRAGLRPGEITVTAEDQTGTQVLQQVVKL